ncbi:HD-GYP domain-containing protein [Candidatus Hydrogenedentota bacterium]
MDVKVMDLIRKYLDKDIMARAADALAAVSPIHLAVYDLDGKGVHIPDSVIAPPDIGADSALLAGIQRAAKNKHGEFVQSNGGAGALLSLIEVDEACIGTLVGFLQNPAENPAELVALVDSLASLISESVRGRYSAVDLVNELSSKYEELSLMHELGEALDISKELDEALDIICESISEMLEADVLVLRVPALDLSRALSSSGGDGGWEVLVDVIGKRVEESGNSTVVNALAEDSGFASVAMGYAQAVAVSFEIDEDTGTIVALRKGPGGEFFAGNIKSLEAVAKQTSIILRNAKIVDARKKLLRALEKREAEVVEMRDVSIFALARLAESRDTETGGHLERIRSYCHLLAVQMSEMPGHEDHITEGFILDIFRSSPLHDIGKVGIPDATLLKPGKLTSEEWAVMQTHAIIGGDTLRDAEEKLKTQGDTFLTMGRVIAYGHHEKWNGKGYPKGSAGEDIPLSARIVALADVYDAMSNKRCYKAAIPHDEVRNIIVQESGKHFDPAVVEAFLAAEDKFIEVLERLGGISEGE